ncbi:hypothetical protein RAD15_07730 [Bradyrhizobium sp. 14AA]
MSSGFAGLAGEIAVAAGVAAGAVGSVDFFLSKSQKEWLGDRSVRVWYWLSSQNQMLRVERLRSQDVFFWLIMLGPTLTSVLTLHFGNLLLTVPWMLIAAMCLGSPKIHKWMYRGYLIGLSGNNIASVSFCVVVTYAAVLLVYGAIVTALYILLSSFISDDAFAFLANGLAIVAYPVLSTAGVLGNVLFSVLILAVMGLAYKVLELLVRKIAEYDKGPVLGASAVLTAVGVFLKNFA